MNSPASTVRSLGSDILDVKCVTEDNYHIDFLFKDGDIVLVSSDGVKFKTHSFILKVASEVFRTTLSLPQPPGVASDGHIISLPEDSRTINAILRMISGMPIPPLDNFQDLEKVLLTVKKWEMPGPPSIIHRMVMPQALFDDPVRLYALACNVGWREAAVIAARHTLDVDLQHEAIAPLLRSMETTDVLKLMDLRTRRRDALLDFLLSYSLPGCLSHLPHSKAKCPDTEFSIQWQWKAFMFTVFIAMDRHPSGKTLFGSHSVLTSDLEDMRNTRCPQCEDQPAFDVDELERELRRQVALLPMTISDR
ncbi:hypothetical protein M422DRAFT_65559 [Sphaerobolus stellatus SS14]|nr:hypothetical protein M422DRAFT_65559 [Sphaerobolus stellatus SS14]